jgi:16S rRNA (guanine527-N7)-methyltransferase
VTRIEEAARRLGDAITSEQAEQLIALADLVALWGTRMNLSGHHGRDAILDELVLDALALRAQVRSILAAEAGQLVVDLGSGAGFPGLPIAIVEPESSVELVDSRERRHHFQRMVGRELDLGNVRPRLGRVESMEPSPAHLVVAQALAQVDQALDWGLRWARPDGLIVIPGTQRPPSPQPRPELGASGTREYETPSGRARTLWWGRLAARVSSAT